MGSPNALTRSSRPGSKLAGLDSGSGAESTFGKEVLGEFCCAKAQWFAAANIRVAPSKRTGRRNLSDALALKMEVFIPFDQKYRIA
jgi:hypothetical protein